MLLYRHEVFYKVFGVQSGINLGSLSKFLYLSIFKSVDHDIINRAALEDGQIDKNHSGREQLYFQ